MVLLIWLDIDHSLMAQGMEREKHVHYRPLDVEVVQEVVESTQRLDNG